MPVRYQLVIDCADPDGHGPAIWFHVVSDAKAVKNRLHLDIHAVITGALSEEGDDLYAVGMKDPEGNEFDIN